MHCRDIETGRLAKKRGHIISENRSARTQYVSWGTAQCIVVGALIRMRNVLRRLAWPANTSYRATCSASNPARKSGATVGGWLKGFVPTFGAEVVRSTLLPLLATNDRVQAAGPAARTSCLGKPSCRPVCCNGWFGPSVVSRASPNYVAPPPSTTRRTTLPRTGLC
jgi:hypothetical protein